MRQKKLLIITLSSGGGCFQYAKELIIRMNRNMEVYLGVENPEPHTIENYKKVKVQGFNKWTRYVSFLSMLIRIRWKESRGHYSGLILMGQTYWDHFIINAFRYTSLPVFYVVHDGKTHFGESSNNAAQKRLTEAQQNSDYLIFLSQYVRNMVETDLKIVKPSTIIPHGWIDFGFLPERVRTKKDKPVLLFLGRLSPYKGLDLLLEAMEKVDPEVYDKLIIMGKSVDNYKPTSSNSKIILTDKEMTINDMLSCLREADIMLFPYIEATQSGVATLAVNYLLPSIVTPVGAFKEQFPEGTALFAEPQAGELAKGITRLCNDNALYEELSKNLFSLREKITWSTLADDLNHFIDTHTGCKSKQE